MKRIAVLFVVLFSAIVIILSFSACGADPFPAEVSEYAKKHDLELLSAEKVKENAVVGKDYVVYGTISYISFSNYEKGSADLEDYLSDIEEDWIKDMIEMSVVGTMRYYISFSGGPFMDYEAYNYSSKKLNINKGDEVAFILTCEDGYAPGTYDYIIKEKIWENRHAETTIEEDHDSLIG